MIPENFAHKLEHPGTRIKEHDLLVCPPFSKDATVKSPKVSFLLVD